MLTIYNISRLVTMEPGPGRDGALGVIPNAALCIDGDRIAWLGSESELESVLNQPHSGGEGGATRALPAGSEKGNRERDVFAGVHGTPFATSRGGATRAPDIDAAGGVMMPGLIDAHTHLIHAGWRAEEFAQRARGVSYQQIAADGGGILSTVRATRAASAEELFTLAAGRAAEAMMRGTTTMEVKSGYGLDVATELKILRVVRTLQGESPIRFIPTFLGAHVVPEEFRGNRAAYVRLVCEEMLPAVAKESLAEFCDVYVANQPHSGGEGGATRALPAGSEKGNKERNVFAGVHGTPFATSRGGATRAPEIVDGAFTPDEARTICVAARERGMRCRLHVDQFQDGGGAALAAELGALSADHCDCTSDAGIKAMARHGVVAGILPAASFFVRHGAYPRLDRFVRAGVPVAIATDYNPGTAPTLDLFLCATIAVTQMGCDPDLALLGITRHAARALGREASIGSLAVGKTADCVLLECASEYFPLYRFGRSAVGLVLCKGEVVWDKIS